MMALGRRWELETIRQAAETVLEHRSYVLGPEVTELENELARFIGTAHAIGCNSGFGAHLLSLLALNIGAESRVLMSPFSPSSYAGAVVRRNADVRLADVAEGDFHLGPEALAGQLDEVDAIVVHHLFGGTADMPKISGPGATPPIIEVLTHSFGAYAGSTRAGTYGKLAISCLREEGGLGAYGDAGMIWTDDSLLADTLREIRKENETTDVYTGVVAGNFHMDTLHAAILLHKMKILDEAMYERQKKVAAMTERLLQCDLPDVVIPRQRGTRSTRLVILAESRNDLCDFLQGRRLAARPWWPVPLHLQPGFRFLGYHRGDFPESEHVAARTVELSIPEDDHGMQELAEALTDFYK